MTKEEANRALSEKLAAAYALINECETLADEHGLCFHLDVAYGMGGYYDGEATDSEYESKWRPSSLSC